DGSSPSEGSAIAPHVGALRSKDLLLATTKSYATGRLSPRAEVAACSSRRGRDRREALVRTRPRDRRSRTTNQWYSTTRIRLPSYVQTGAPGNMSDAADSRARMWTRLPPAVTVSRRTFGQAPPQRWAFVPAK